ncbi:hypothetical protein BpHYR1_050989 [Brachionus plicatilis]|uniref:Uncharacterized protein n=1 Tax=Brachionus plicatilis TaxID=10195 RepID=A0A3M7QX91_BRAPC|nr:hypothetical protein BpHYR1_050989 [Brachionus plicatilis]
MTNIKKQPLILNPTLGMFDQRLLLNLFIIRRFDLNPSEMKKIECFGSKIKTNYPTKFYYSNLSNLVFELLIDSEKNHS